MAEKIVMSDKALIVTFDKNNEPQFKFNGAWSVRDLGHARVGLFRAFKHYMKEVRQKEQVT